MTASPNSFASVQSELQTAQPVEARGFLAWLRRLLFGDPVTRSVETTVAEMNADQTATASSAEAPATYVTAPGGYRIRIPQPDDVHHGIDAMIPSVRDGLSLIPPLPHVVTELLREIQDPNATAASVGKIAASDPALAASLIRTVNSAAFALHRKITSAHEAVNYLGFSSVKSMVLHLQLEQALGSGGATDPDVQDLWVHSVMVSFIADTLAKRVPDVDRGFATTLGLLHDIGKLVVLTRFPEEAKQLRAIRTAPGEHKQALADERRVLGVTHADLGANVAAKWGLPGDLVRSIRFHHFPHKAFEATDPEQFHKTMFLVQIANQLAKYCYVYTDETEIDVVDPSSLKLLGFGPNLTSLLDDEVRAAASRAIFIAQDQQAFSGVRRFLQLHHGGPAATLLAAAAQTPADAPLQITVDDTAADALLPSSLDAGHDDPDAKHRVRSTVTSTDQGLRSLNQDLNKLLAKTELPGPLQLSMGMTARCVLANIPLDRTEKVELSLVRDGNEGSMVLRASALGFARRFNAEVDPIAARRVLGTEMANVLNLGWFDRISCSADGTTLVFTTKQAA